MMSKDEKKCSKENGECEEKKDCKNHSKDCHEHHGGKCKELEAKIELLEKQVEENKKARNQVNEEIKPTYEADAVNTDDYYETIEKMFIEFKANGVYYNSTAFLQDLLTRVQNAKFTAKSGS